MGFETTAALVALVVSLIALIIALLQLAQSLFGTAEGYKRCAESVIGHWEGLRWRRFLLSELRIEVQYITPQILLVSPSSKQWLEDAYNRRFNEGKPDRDHVCILHDHVIRTAHTQSKDLPPQFGSRWRRNYWVPWKNWLSQKTHPWEYPNKMRILESTACGPEDESTHPAYDFHSHRRSDTLPFTANQILIARQESSPMKGPGQDYELRVTWDAFLKEVCAVYTSYRPHLRHQSSTEYRPGLHARDDSHLSRFSRKKEQKPIPPPRLDDSNLARTDAAITFRQWSWDLMPSDMIRPLATISVGHIVILAVRLGMQWRVMNLESGMSADGHGYSLGGTKSDKLGYVFKLVAMGFKNKPWRLIPNKATDKLICGILPGCPGLVKRDYDFVDSNRQSLLTMQRALKSDHILTQIGIPRPTRELLSKGIPGHGSLFTIHNEIVPLLCTFLPLKGSSAVRHYAHCWEERRQGVLFLWEGRYTLLYYLRKEVEQDEVKARENGLAETLKYLLKLEKDYPADFFGLKDGKAIDKQCLDDIRINVNQTRQKEQPRRSQEEAETREAEGERRREDLVQLCREIHDFTGIKFQNLGLGEEDEQGRTHYENLVAAHLTMAAHATISVYQEKEEKDLPSCPMLETQSIPVEYKPILDSLESPKPPWLVCRLMANAKKYVESYKSGENAVAPYLTRRGCHERRSDLDAAWWMLMLRGIAWNMSTLEHSWGEPIPSAFYDNHVPVWIT